VAVTEFVFCGRFAALIFKEAVAADPAIVSVAAPRVTVPAVKVTVPDGEVVPPVAFTVAVSVASDVWASEAVLDMRVVEVETSAAFTVTFMDPAEPVKLPPGTNVPVIVFAPDAREAPFTERDAETRPEADGTSGTFPRTVLPIVKVTLPDGIAEADEGLTDAVI